MTWDILEPLQYRLQSWALSHIIPNASNVPNRKRLAEYHEINNHDAQKGRETTTSSSFDHSHWDAVLRAHVRVNGSVGEMTGVNLVDYSGVAADLHFHAYLEQLEQADPDKLSPPEQLAFWINAYNALCIRLVVEHEKTHPPVNSITDLSDTSAGGRGAVWDQVAGKVHGQDMTLNQIEHVKLRQSWDEPAVHACIVCASASCPNLRPEAFVASRLRQQMDDQVRQWLAHPSKGSYWDAHRHRLYLSRIVLWFASDFGHWKGIRRWIQVYVSDQSARQALDRGRVSVRYFKYSWKINRATTEAKTIATAIASSDL